jgi:hypothetical protein
MCLNVQVYQSWIFGSSVARQHFIGKAITHPFGVWSRSMSTWWKACLMSFQIDLLSSQYHISKASKPSRYFCRCFCRELHYYHGLVIHPWDIGPSGSTPQGTHQGSLWMSSSLATTLGGQQGRPSQAGGPVQFKFEFSSAFRTSL